MREIVPPVRPLHVAAFSLLPQQLVRAGLDSPQLLPSPFSGLSEADV